VTEQVSHSVERHSLLNQARGEVMAEVVPAELGDLGAFKRRRPCLLEAASDFKDAFSTLRLIAPTSQYTSGRNVG
jgi:hypothetical protein